MSSIQDREAALLASNVPLPAWLLLPAPAPVAAPPILAWGEVVFLAALAVAYTAAVVLGGGAAHVL